MTLYEMYGATIKTDEPVTAVWHKDRALKISRF